MYFELKKAGLRVDRQIEIPFQYKGVKLDVGYRLDLLVEDKVIVEIKSVNDFSALHFKQLTTYLKLKKLKLGLLVNFNTLNIREGIARIANNL